MGVGSRFAQPLTLISDGHQVVACGRLGFFGCETHAEVAITMRQAGRGIATASGMFANPDYDPEHCEEVVGRRRTEKGDEEDEWMLTADVRPEAVAVQIASAAWPSFAFTTTPKWGGTGAPVEARGVIRYHRIDPGVEVHVWHGDKDQNPLEVRWVPAGGL